MLRFGNGDVVAVVAVVAVAVVAVGADKKVTGAGQAALLAAQKSSNRV